MKTTLILSGLLFLIAICTISVKGEPIHEIVCFEGPYLKEDTLRNKNMHIRSFKLEIVPPSSGVQFYRNGILFLSYSKADEKVPERHVSFGALRTYTSLIADTLPVNLKPFNFEGQVLFPSEATTFSSDYNTMYLSLIPKNSKNEKIFRAELTQSGWKIDSDPLEICTGDQIYSHPCLSFDGTFLIFSSDMSGTKGDLDLFITRQEGDNWTIPQNLGQNINSEGNELFPSLDSRNNLYFSSDGIPGEGGYDVFICRYNGTGWEKPQNLTAVINSKDDELAFTINKLDSNTAFYTSRTRSGKYRTQLFIIELKPEISLYSKVTLGEQFLALAETRGLTDGHEKQVKEANTMASKDSHEIQKEQPQKKTDEYGVGTVTKITQISQEPKNEGKTSTVISPTEAEPQELSVPAQVKQEQGLESINDIVVYRVQITASTKPVGTQNIVLAGRSYKTFEYLYQGGYRTTVGEFSTLEDATRLQSVCRQNGYKQAFVVAFKNNIRSTDPNLFK